MTTPSPLYTTAIGRKFNADGSVRAFPGNTLIAYVTPAHAQYAELLWAQGALIGALGEILTPLPASSLHMTVFEGVTDATRRPEKWTRFLPVDAPLAETDALMSRVVPGVPVPERIEMVFDYLGPGIEALGIRLRAADAAVERALRDYRNALADATGIRFPDHDQYVFHISLAYRIIQADAAQTRAFDVVRGRIEARLRERFGVLRLGAPVLTFFEDMFAFPQVRAGR